MSTSDRRPPSQTPGRAAIRRGDEPADLPVAALEAEARVVSSGVRKVFTPHHPVQSGGRLAGRQQEVNRIVFALNTPGLYPVIAGEHGTGRSSLANVAAHSYHQSTTRAVYTKRCDHTDTFATILNEPLLAVRVDALRHEHVVEDARTQKGEIAPLGIVKGGRDHQQKTTTTYRPEGDIGASVAARHLAPLPALFVVDNLDQVADPTTVHKMAELFKHLSDMAASFKLLLAGDHGTFDHMATASQLMTLPIRRVTLHPMSEEHLQEIVTDGENRLGLTFSAKATAAIAWISAGYPQFTHLLALKCAENAIRTGRPKVDLYELVDIMREAADDADTALQESYRSSIAVQPKTHGELLAIAASLEENEFTPSQLRAAVNGRFDVKGPLGHLASVDGPTILRRVGRGVYQFDDPRMRGYVRLVARMTEPPD